MLKEKVFALLDTCHQEIAFSEMLGCPLGTEVEKPEELRVFFQRHIDVLQAFLIKLVSQELIDLVAYAGKIGK